MAFTYRRVGVGLMVPPAAHGRPVRVVQSCEYLGRRWMQKIYFLAIQEPIFGGF